MSRILPRIVVRAPSSAPVLMSSTSTISTPTGLASSRANGSRPNAAMWVTSISPHTQTHCSRSPRKRCPRGPIVSDHRWQPENQRTNMVRALTFKCCTERKQPETAGVPSVTPRVTRHAFSHRFTTVRRDIRLVIHRRPPDRLAISARTAPMRCALRCDRGAALANERECAINTYECN